MGTLLMGKKYIKKHNPQTPKQFSIVGSYYNWSYIIEKLKNVANQKLHSSAELSVSFNFSGQISLLVLPL